VSEAATYYVATSGSDSAAGSLAQPFRSIAKGLSSMGAGDTLYIRGGTYNERINSNSQTIPTGNSWTDAPIISGYPGETAVLAVGGAGELINLPHAYIKYVSFENLVLDGLTTIDNVISLGSSGAHHVRFKNCEVKNAGHIGVFFHGSFNIFTGGQVHHIGNVSLYPRPSNRHYGFYVGGSDNLIENARIHHTNDYGIHNYHGITLSSRNIYRNLTLHDTSLLYDSGAAIIASRSDSVLIYNNVLYGNTGHGILAGSQGSNTRIYNNTVYGGAQTGIYVEPGASGTDVRNNIAYGNGTTQILGLGVGTVLANNLITNPRFVNSAAFDFNIQAGSPAIDAGVALSQVQTDFKGTARPQGGAYDIGAYESGGSADSTPPSPPRNVALQ
jgi:parallel beta-helix repeat protein